MSLIETPAKLISGVGSGIKSPVGALTNFIKNPFSRSTNKDSLPKPDYPAGFLITEITDDANSGQQIQLVGNMMPKDRFDREVSLRAQKDNYPGNDFPVVHILGYEENDITVKGRLYDKRYSDPKFRGVANEIREAMEEMEKRKNIVKISLGGWARYALMSKVKTSERTLADIDYEITFIILGTKAPKNYQLIDRLQDIPVDVNTALIAEAEAFSAAYSSAPDSMPASIADIMNQATSAVAGILKTVTGFVDGVVSTGEDITNSLGRAIGLIRYARTQLVVYRRRVGAISYSLEFNHVKVPPRYRSSAFIANSITATLSLQQLLNQLLERFRDLAKTVPMSRHRVIVQDTLQKLSTKFYGVPDYWKKIYDHNKLSSTNLVVGSVLEIPKL